MIKELDLVVLKRDVDAAGLKAGDVGSAVIAHSGGAAFEVEFSTLAGDTIAVLTVNASDLRAARVREILHAREVA
ncbi:MAG: DUF4926 domain-containing protein [Parvularculaceae bacterium]